MFSKTMSNRMKAAGIAAVLCLSVTAAAIPMMTDSMMNVEAVSIGETIEVKEKYVGYTADIATSGIKTITFNCTADYTGTFSYGFGINTATAPDYWVELPQGEVEVEEGVPFEVTFDVSEYELKYDAKGTQYPATYEFRNYYSGGDGWITINSATANGGSTTTDPTNPTDPITPTDPEDSKGGAITDGSTTKNNKSGTWNFKDNQDGTGTMTATQARQVTVDYVLTKGYDEDTYAAEGVVPVEGVDPINSHKFFYRDFGLGQVGAAAGVMVESIQATITSDAPIKRFMYGGGMNVENGSPADTESAKVAAGVKEEGGYWYNDTGDDEYDKFIEAGVEFGINIGRGYDLSSEDSQLGEYFDVIWDVPEDVKPYQNSGSVSFQYWYGVVDTEEYTEAETVNLIGGVLTYTEEKTFDYTDRISADVNKTLIAKDKENNMGGVTLSEMGLDANDSVKAVVFTLDVASDLDKLVYAVGASVDEGWQQWSDKDGGDEWDYCVLDTKKGEVQIAWIVPDGVDINEEYGEVQLGYWYGGQGETELDSVTLKSVEVFYHEEEAPTDEPTDEPTDAPTETDAPTDEPTDPMKVTMYGDVNVDDSVTIVDVVMLCRYAMGAETVTEQGKLNADVDLDGKSDATDASYIIQSLVNLITLPVK